MSGKAYTYDELILILGDLADKYNMDEDDATTMGILFGSLYHQAQENASQSDVDGLNAELDDKAKEDYEIDYNNFHIDDVPYMFVAMDIVCQLCGNYMDVTSSLEGHDKCIKCRNKGKDLDWSDCKVGIRY